MVRSAGIEQYPISHIQQGFAIYNYCFVSSYVSSFLNVPPFFISLKLPVYLVDQVLNGSGMLTELLKVTQLLTDHL